MTIHTSSDSLLHPNASLVISQFPLDLYCLMSRPSSFIFTTFYIANIFLLIPLSSKILYHSFQERQKNHSTSSGAMMSHTDSITYHMVIMELSCLSGGIFCCWGIFRHNLTILFVGRLHYSFTAYGEILFHNLTCMERYLAVIHPITYRKLRSERGTRIRNVSIGCVWLLSFFGMGLGMMKDVMLAVDFCLLVSSLTAVSFFSLSVLFVLIHPGPGEQGVGRKRVDQSKHKAIYTIVAILGALVLRLASGLVWAVLLEANESNHCLIKGCVFWFNLPCSLVLPLLFLHKAGKLVVVCNKKNIQ